MFGGGGAGEKHFSAGLDGLRVEEKSSVKSKKKMSAKTVQHSKARGGKKCVYVYSYTRL